MDVKHPAKEHQKFSPANSFRPNMLITLLWIQTFPSGQLLLFFFLLFLVSMFQELKSICSSRGAQALAVSKVHIGSINHLVVAVPSFPFG